MDQKKIKINYLPELSAFFLGRSGPSVVSVNLTERCNQHCIYCEIGHQNPAPGADFLRKEDLFWIIDQMSENKLRRLSMCGGEPFLFPQLMEVIDYAWSKGIRSNVTSNGMTVYRLKPEELELMKRCETTVNISIDSFDEKIQQLTRGHERAFADPCRSVQTLLENKIPILVLSAISKYNYRDLYDSMLKAYDAGVRQLLYQPVISFSNFPDKAAIAAKHSLNVSPAETELLLDELRKIHRFEKKHSISTNVYRIINWIGSYLELGGEYRQQWFFHEVLNKFYCREAFAVIDIDYHGGIQPCGLSSAAVNIRDQRDEGLMPLWRKATKDLHQDLKSGKFIPACNACCHKFGRNMLASVMKYPFANRAALWSLTPLLASRIVNTAFKKISAG
jgi:MoaA/NifB/PqqE/SkfB family radical SAM enzyme